MTRSGILGNSSVHSFTDLGLSGQLLLYLFVFLILAIVLIVIRWKDIPTSKQDVSAYSREFWIFMGAAVLCFMAFQVLAYTSMPVYNKIAAGLGFELNMAPPTDTYDAYSLPQLIFSVFLAILSGTGQFFWWKKMNKKELRSALALPFVISLGISALIISLAKLTEPAYLILMIASVYSVVANAKILFSLAKSNIKLSGGSIAHIGIAMMLIGILFSSGYSKILSTNYTSMVWSKEFPDEVNQNNLLLFVNEPRQMEDYSMIYKGLRKLTKEVGMVDVNSVTPTAFPNKVVRKSGITYDTLTLINQENSYFEIEYHNDGGKQFTLFPRVQINETMNMTVYSPDIHRTVGADMYTHVRTFPKPASEADWSEAEEMQVEIGSKFFVNDYVATLEKLEPISEINGQRIGDNDVAVKAVINVQGEFQNYVSEPVFIIKEREFVGRVDDQVHDLAFRISIQNILPQENAVIFSVQTTQKDWIILEAVEKPWINILWIGTLLLVLGLGIAIARRYSEFMKMRDKGVEA